ncbi:MAG: hypothetical protein IJW72_06710 [Alphaproteobacteria bacterium]|nr:hypothetical protein [Alphaproteobacteria bacterium]MBQ7285923.1 hypothetical protein [Alphaproteobacteria bacterium]
MKKMLCLVFLLNACAWVENLYWEEPDYNRLAAHMSVVDKSPRFVTYEYRDIGVDEVAPIAALYCQERGNLQAALYEITMHRNNARRATFVCKKTDEI